MREKGKEKTLTLRAMQISRAIFGGGARASKITPLIDSKRGFPQRNPILAIDREYPIGDASTLIEPCGYRAFGMPHPTIGGIPDIVYLSDIKIFDGKVYDAIRPRNIDIVPPSTLTKAT